MKLNSPLFDKIRVKPGEDRRTRAPETPCCEWKGCNNASTHRAPKGRDSANEHWRFCLEHVRAYNASYNYFKGMSADDVSKYQKASHVAMRCSRTGPSGLLALCTAAKTATERPAAQREPARGSFHSAGNA